MWSSGARGAGLGGELPSASGVAADQGDTVPGVGVVVVAAPGLPGLPGGADDGGGEAVGGGAQGVGGDGGQVEQAAAGLGAVDLLQPEDVRVEVGDGGGDTLGVDDAVGQRTAVQQVEGGQAHKYRP